MWCSIGLCIAQLLAVLVSAGYGIVHMIQVYVAINLLWILVWHYFARREIDIRLTEIIRDMAPYIVLTLVLVVAAYLLTAGIANLYLSLAAKVLFVATGYVLALWLLQSTIFKESVNFFLKRQLK
jgi:hypothetical protein